jgi:F-type H+-transporting ATPase subunit epsilon
MEKKVRCIIVTPERTVLDATADFIAFPAFDGEVGIMPGRAPLVARLGAGELRLTSGNSSQRYSIDGGFAQVIKNVVTILTPRARPVADLDPEQLQQQLSEINAEVPTTDEAFASKEQRLVRVRTQLHLAKK